MKMDNVKFPGIPQMNAFNLSLDWNVQSLCDWLQHLPESKPEKSCEQICSVLQALSQAGFDENSHSLFLEEIRAYVNIFEKRVESVYLESPVPLSDHQQQCVESLVWCFISLAKNYQKLVEESANKKTKAAMIYRALFALAQAYQHMSALYGEPCDGFWEMCYQFYSIAEMHGLLDIEIGEGERYCTNINSLFKLILVFSLCDYQQFRPREMKWVFSYLGKYADQMPITKQVKKDHLKGIFAVELKNDRKPISLSREIQIQPDSSTRFIAPAMLAKKIYQTLQEEHGKTGAIMEINKLVLMKVVKTLGLSQTRKFKRMQGQNQQIRGLIGFADIRDYLLQSVSDEVQSSKTPDEPKGIKPYDYDTSKYELINEGDEEIYNKSLKLSKVHHKDESINKIFAVSEGLSSKIKVWDSEAQIPTSFDVYFSNFPILNSSAKGYGVGVNNYQAKAKVGDLFALVSDQEQQIELALIRWIRRLSDEQFEFGIELIGVSTELVLMKGRGSQLKQTWAIFLPGREILKQFDSLVYSSGEFNIGELVTVLKDGQDVVCRLEKQINATPSVTQVELSYV